MQLGSARKCAERVEPAKSQILRPFFILDSPNFTGTYDGTSYCSTAFIEVRRNDRTDGFGSNFNGTASGLAQPIGGSLLGKRRITGKRNNLSSCSAGLSISLPYNFSPVHDFELTSCSIHELLNFSLEAPLNNNSLIHSV